MAIKLKKEQDKNQLPAKLDKLLLQGFSFQQIAAKYEEAFKTTKGEIEEYLESNDDGFDLTEKTIKCDQGSVTYVERTSYDYDKDAIVELVKSGAVTLETLIGLATFPAEKMKVALGESNFKSVATEKTSTYLTLKASADFKEECDRKFADILPKEEKRDFSEAEKVVAKAEKAVVAAPKKEAPKAKAPKKEKLDEAIEEAKRARELASASKAPKASVEDDLNAILGE
jgi:hypothetical protein